MNNRPKKSLLLGLLPASLVQVRGSRGGAVRYLTFDDGPHPEHTPRLLDVLARHDVRATFFLVGKHAEAHPGLVERIVVEGHALGNHSYSHPLFTRMRLRDQLEEIDRTDRLLERFDGRPIHGVRPPQGRIPIALLVHFLRTRRHLVHWSYDSLDYRQRPEAEVAQWLRECPPTAGDIILMHDDAACAANVLDCTLPEWLAAGHRFEALPALAS